ncbi:MAG TPA: hypothetical protein RMH85_03330 [Polyangiaceae bacterium LLY-WYZ-15_(1-7)]|nr:hypothetical protein [Sandaracinus sp.]HJK90301.1 hypothetical protein [Polyangiaceae bacterium LLY-WYZ-15_(1-7)]MBJ70428.1 hypothetical protein [Sandaracinus sp.]HJL02895.1 hypothetical protein [Polyangiaceae bacterium LLY-WYZ-15_(1-7)]HJL07497.1 hypothetical protein [Polyangiaceae bacterium LLY-WYZ-15_(1-7)]
MARSWLYALLLTQAVEAPIYLRALAHRPLRERLPLALLPSAFTHPLLWFALFPALHPELGYWATVAIGEGSVVLVEAALLASFLPGPGGQAPWRSALRPALLWAAFANGASVLVGFASSWLFGVP